MHILHPVFLAHFPDNRSNLASQKSSQQENASFPGYSGAVLDTSKKNTLVSGVCCFSSSLSIGARKLLQGLGNPSPIFHT